MFLGLDDTRSGLKAVLENKKILKLIHDCRNDWDSLLHQYSVRIYNFIDTQEAYFIFKLFYYQEITLPISLSKFIEIITKAKLEYKQKFKNVMSEDPYMWGNRPLTSEQLAYASEDVVYLIKAWLELKDKFNENLKEIIFFLTILKVVDISMFTQFREYLVANIIYFGMLENVFSNPSIYAYLFAMDYVYNFLQIKVMTENKKEGDVNFFMKDNNLLPDEEYYRFVKDDSNNAKTTASIIKFGINFKKKQRILSLKQFKEEEMALMEKMAKCSKKKVHGETETSFKTAKNKFNNYHHQSHQGSNPTHNHYKKYTTNYNSKSNSNENKYHHHHLNESSTHNKSLNFYHYKNQFKNNSHKNNYNRKNMGEGANSSININNFNFNDSSEDRKINHVINEENASTPIETNKNSHTHFLKANLNHHYNGQFHNHYHFNTHFNNHNKYNPYYRNKKKKSSKKENKHPISPNSKLSFQNEMESNYHNENLYNSDNSQNAMASNQQKRKASF